MATILTLNISIPDADVADVIAAMKARYATPANPSPTQAQIRAALEDGVREDMKKATLQYRRDQAAVAAPVLG